MGRAFEFRKARKLKRWGNMARVFTRLGKEITIAAKEGGGDPASNPKLRALIQNAKSENMPKDNIDRAIKRATEKDLADYKQMVYEGYGPSGVAVVVETATDNPTRTVANVRSIFNKAGGSLGTSGSLSFLFDHKSFFKIQLKEGMDLEELEFELIDFGAEELFAEEEVVVIYGQYEAFGSLQKVLEEKGYEILNSGFERIPNDFKEVSATVQAEIEKMLEKFDDDDDVQNVYHNMKEAE